MEIVSHGWSQDVRRRSIRKPPPNPPTCMLIAIVDLLHKMLGKEARIAFTKVLRVHINFLPLLLELPLLSWLLYPIDLFVMDRLNESTPKPDEGQDEHLSI
jgi:hypothetical protein